MSWFKKPTVHPEDGRSKQNNGSARKRGGGRVRATEIQALEQRLYFSTASAHRPTPQLATPLVGHALHLALTAHHAATKVLGQAARGHASVTRPPAHLSAKPVHKPALPLVHRPVKPPHTKPQPKPTNSAARSHTVTSTSKPHARPGSATASTTVATPAAATTSTTQVGSVSIPHSTDPLYTIAVQKDGKIVVLNAHSGTFALLRYTSLGKLDSSFASTGTAALSFDAGSDTAHAVVIDYSGTATTNPNYGKILVAGSSSGGFAIARFNTGGKLDTTFGTGGKVSGIVPGGSANGILITATDTILVGGTDANGKPVVVRLTSKGALDATFGTSGVYQGPLTDFNGHTTAITPTASGAMAPALSSGGTMSPADCGGGCGSCSAPNINFDNGGSEYCAVEGTTFYAGGSISDPNPYASLSGTVDYGDGTGAQPLSIDSSGNFTLDHTYDEEATNTITISVTDTNDGEQAGGYAQVMVSDAAPDSVSISGGNSVTAGIPYSASGSFSDVDYGGGEASYTASADYGDQTGPQPVTLSGNIFVLSHTYWQTAPDTITVTINKLENGESTSASGQLQVNVTPVNVASPTLTQQGSTYTVNLSAGSIDGRTIGTWTVEWNDGLSSSASGTATQISHTYSNTPDGLGVTVFAYDSGGNLLTTFTLVSPSLVSSFGSTVPGTNDSVIVLDPTAAGALTANGNGKMIVGGAVVVDSSSSSALTATGNAYLSAGSFAIHGNYRLSGHPTLTPTPTVGAAALADPLGSLTAPAPGTTFPAVKLTGGSQTILPGTYSSISVSGQGSLTMDPGVYTILGGGFSVSGHGSVSGSGVAIVNTADLRGRTGSIDFSGNGTWNLTPMSSGSLLGVIIFQPRASSAPVSISGNAVGGVFGTIYAPSALVSVTGNGQLSMAIDSDQLRLTGNGQLIDAGIVGGNGYTVAATEGTALSNVTVARFYGVIAGGAIADTTAMINWGDNPADSPGTITADPAGGYDVVGSTVYSEEGAYAITVQLVVQGVVTCTVASVANVGDAPLTAGALTPPVATEGFATTNDATVFHFTDADPAAASGDYSATVMLGDQTTASGLVVINPNGGFDVQLPSHIYVEELTNAAFSVTVRDDEGGTGTGVRSVASASTSSFTVADAGLNSTPADLTPPSVNEFAPTGDVALLHFTDGDPNGALVDYTATVQWGDGTPNNTSADGSGSVWIVPASGGGFDVMGNHPYADELSNGTFRVTVNDHGASTSQSDPNFSVSEVPVVPTGGFSLTATTGSAFANRTVGQFIDPSGAENPNDLNDASSEYSATIAWGDGGTTSGTLSYSAGTFTVQGSYTYMSAGNYTIVVTVSHGGLSRTANSNASVAINRPNHPPHFTSDPLATRAGQAYPVDLSTTGTGTDRILEIVAKNNNQLAYPATGADPDGDPISFSMLEGPAGMQIDSATGVLTWTPAVSDVGLYSVRLRVTDSHGLYDPAADQVFRVRVRANVPDRPPQFTTDPVVFAYVGKIYTYGSHAFDPDGDTLTYAYVQDADPTRNPGGDFHLNTSSGAVTWTPTADEVGKTYPVKLTVTDPLSLGDEQDYQVVVMQDPANHPPKIVSSPVESTEAGSLYQYQVVAIDADKDPLTYFFNPGDAPDWMNIDANSGLITGTSPAGISQAPTVTVHVSDGRGGFDQQTFVLNVTTAAPATIRGSVYDDLNGNGIWDNQPGQPAAGTTFNYFTTIRNTDFVSAGYGGMRGVGSGQIELNGVSGPVTAAYLYWHGPTDSTDPDANATVSFNGTAIVGDNIGVAADNGWEIYGFTNSQAYRADVTSLINGNGTYALADFLKTGSENIDINGASLLVFYNDGNPANNRDIVLFDGNYSNQIDSSDSFSVQPWDVNLNGIDYSGGDASVELHVSDGQGDSDHNDDALMLNGQTLAEAGDIFAGATVPNNATSAAKYGGGLWDIKDFSIATFLSSGTNDLNLTTDVSSVAGPVDYLSLVVAAVNLPAGDAPESALPNQTIYLDQNQDHKLDPGEEFTTTDASGNYGFANLAPGTYHVAEVPEDGWVQTAPAPDFEWTITVASGDDKSDVNFGNQQLQRANRNPEITSPLPPATAQLGQLYSYQVTAVDPDNDPLTYDLPIHPDGMAIDPATGKIIWQPSSSQVGDATVVVRVQDDRGGSALQSCTITVPDPQAPSITSSPHLPAALRHAWSYQVAATDPNGDGLVYELDPESVQRGLQIDNTTGLITWTPGAVGDFAVRVTVTDADGLSGSQNFTVPVVSTDTPPFIISKPNGPVLLNKTWTYQVVAQDYDDASSNLTYSLDSVGTAAGMRIDSSGLLTWTPTMMGTFSAVVIVSDPSKETGWQHIALPVQQSPSTDSPPAFTTKPTGPAMIDRPWQYLVQASDPDGQAVTLSVLHFTDSTGASITPASGDYSVTSPAPGQMLIQWTPRDPSRYAMPPQFPVHFDVQADDGTSQVIQSFDLSVLGNAPPIILRAPVQAGAELGAASTLSFDVIDYNADPLSFQLVDVNGLPVSAVFSPQSIGAASTNPTAPNTVDFTYTPTATGTQDLRLLVSDGQATVQQPIKLIVQTTESPTASLTARSVIAAGETFTAQVVASDPQNQPLAYSLQFFAGDPTKPVPTGMTIDPQTGLIAWTPSAAQVTADPSKPYQFEVIVSDGTNSATVGPVSLTVVARLVNNPPVITSDPTGTRASADRPLIYDAKAVDPDNDPLTWTLVSGPITSRIDPNTGEFVWQPTASEFGQDEVARIQVSDPYGATAQQEIDLNAETSYVPLNSPPRIDSTPPLPGNGGETYTYFVHGVDPDGERLTFSLEEYAGGTLGGLTIVPVDANTAEVQWVSPTANDSRDFVIRATDERGASCTQRVLLTIGSSTGTRPSVDTPPTITSTPAYSVPAGTAYNYQVVAQDPDGAPSYSVGAWVFDNTAANGQGATVSWLSINGSSGALTGSAATPGVYLVEVSATQNGVSAIQRYKLTVTDPNAANTPPTIQPPAGPIQAAVGEKLSYQVQASDPDGDPLAYWLIDSVGNPTTNVNGLTVGTSGLVAWTVPTGATDRTFKVRVIDSFGNYAEQSYNIQIVADQPPTVSMSLTTLTPAIGSTMGFVVTAGDDVGLTDLHVTLTIPGTGTVTLPVSPAGLATYTVPDGTAFTATATAVDTAGHVVTTASQTITPPAADTSAPSVAVDNMGGDGVITQPTAINGHVYDLDENLAYYSLTATPLDGGTGAVTLVEQGTFNGTNRISDVGSSSADVLITTINPLTLGNGNYQFNLFAEDTTGKTASVSFNATIQSSTKVGDYSLSFTDLETKIGNVPITITRTYSSQRAGVKGDFGYGWSLGMTNSGMQVDVPKGGDQLLGNLGWQAAYQNGTRIEITLPDGSKRGFTTVLIPDTGGYAGSGGLLGMANLYLVAFMPDVDSRDTSLQIETGQYSPLIVDPDSGLPTNLGLPEVLTDGGFQSTVVYYDQDTNELREPTMGGGLPFNPATYGWKFKVQQVDGSVYEYDSGTGQLLDYVDRLGNTINYSDGGDTLEAKDNTGKLLSTVQINRTDGRIDTIDAIWNDGTNTLTKTLQYGYNADGDLATFTDFNNTVTQYTYDRLYQKQSDGTWVDAGDLGRPHFLTRITDVATGIATMTATFDSSGNLSGLVDASGASAGISYTLDDNTVTLPSGQTPQITIDALGNKSGVIRDANGNIVRKFQQTGTDTYLVTVYEYDANNNQTAASKPHEVTGSARYTWQPGAGDWANQSEYGDPNNLGLPTVVTDANGKTTRYTYDGHGNVTSVVDPLNQTTTNVYDDSNGQLKQSSDGTGATSTYTYDPRGNLQNVQQTDANGNLVTVITPQFNDLDLMTSFKNAAGQTTQVGYDTRGRQTSTQYTSADGTLVEDRTDYDDQDRIKGTQHYVNGTLVSSTSMFYDASGRLLTSTDPFGNVTTTRYDVRGDIVELRTPAKDENGNDVMVVVRKAYDVNGREIAQTDPFIEGVTPTADLRVTHTIYDAAGRVVETRRLAGVGIDLTYVSGGTGTDHLGGIFQSSFSYDAATNTYGGVPAASVVLSSEGTHYDDQGRVDYTTSDTQLVTHYAYDANGNQTKTWYDIDLHGDGNTEHVETDTVYDDAGQQTRVTDPAGRVTDSKYNAAGQLTDTIDYGVVAPGVTPGGTGDNTGDDMLAQTKYDGLGREAASIDALGRETDSEYDDAGRLIAVTLPAVVIVRPGDNTATSVRPRYEYHYDDFGHKTFEISNIYLDPATNEVVYVTKDANGNATLTTRAVDAAPDTWPTDKGDVTAYTYDGQGHQLTRTLPGGEVEKTFYDTSGSVADGEVTYTIDFAGRVTAYQYDNTPTGGGRAVAVRYYNTQAYSTPSDYQTDPNGFAARTISNTYDAFGRQVKVTDSAFATPTSYTYDADGRVIKIDSPQGTVHYAYDSLGRKIATWTGSGETFTDALTSSTTLTQYDYDQLNRLTKTTATRRFGQDVDVDPNTAGAQPEVTKTVFNVDGQVDYETATTAGGTVTTADAYDPQGRPTSVDHFVDNNNDHVFNAGDTLLSDTSDTYNNDGTRKGETSTDAQGNVTTEAWGYTDDGQVASETFDGHDDQGNPLDYTDTFTYDAAGNRATLTHADRTPGGPGSAGANYVVTDQYDGDDRLVSEAKDVGGSTDTADDTYTVYGYKGTDQWTQTVHQGLTAGGSITQTTTYTYDAAGHMTGVSVNSGGATTSVTYAYDANGVRVERTDNGGQRTVYLVDPDNATGYTQVLEQGVDANGDHKLDASEVQQAFTIGTRVLAQATATQVLKFLTDAHGSTRAVLDAGAATLNAAAVLQNYVYSAFGSDLGLPSSPLTAMRYAGEMIDPVTGLSYNRARWYDPSTGRFTQLDTDGGDSQDPITLNKYLYGNGDPVSFGDPSGHDGLVDMLVTMGIDQIVSKAQGLYEGAQTSIANAKMLTRLALLASYVISYRLPLSIGQEGFLTLYYGYEESVFEKTYSGNVNGAKILSHVPDIIGYIASLARSIGTDTGNLPELQNPFLSSALKGKTKYLTVIPYTGYRDKDNRLAYFFGVLETTYNGLEEVIKEGKDDWIEAVYNTAKNALGFDGQLNKRTWHHNEVLGVMESVLKSRHSGPDRNHSGGPVLWTVLNNQDYK